MARNDLAVARAAVNFYDKEYGLDYKPTFTLPDKSRPRDRYLSRSDAARLLLGARRTHNRHLARFILISLYTGTRSSTVLSMQWEPSPAGGWFDLENGIMHRLAEGERETRKRKPAAVIPNRLLSALKRWRRLDSVNGARIPYVVHYKGKPIKNIKKAWNSARIAAGLPEWVIPHCLRHTSVTWAMQAGKPVNVVKSFYGLTDRVLEDVYWHHHPDYQKEMRR